MIPWYVNGSLPPEQAVLVRAYGQSNAACAAEICRQRDLAAQVAIAEPVDAQRMHSWEVLKARIVSDITTQAMDIERAPLTSWLNRGVMALFGTAAAACLVLAVQLSQPAETGLVTLTSENEVAASLIKFQPIPGLPEDQLTALLSPHGASLLAGPTDTGIYVATLQPDANPKAIADVLLSMPEILFAAPESDQ